jgi:hypothetical protein
MLTRTPRTNRSVVTGSPSTPALSTPFCSAENDVGTCEGGSRVLYVPQVLKRFLERSPHFASSASPLGLIRGRGAHHAPVSLRLRARLSGAP